MISLALYSPWIPVFLRTGTSSGTREAGSRAFVSFMNEVSAWLTVGPFAGLLPAWRPIWGWFPIVMGIGFMLSVALRRYLTTTDAHNPAAAGSAHATPPSVAADSSSANQPHDGSNTEFRTPNTEHRPTDQPTYLLIPWLIGMPLLMYIVGATDDNYLKFLTTVVPAVWLAFLYGIRLIVPYAFRLTTRGWVWIIPFLLIPFSFSSMGTALYRQIFDPATFRADYRGMVAQIEAEGYDAAGIVLNAPNQWEVFTYYYDGPATVYPYPRQKEPAPEVEATVLEMLDAHERIYALFWGFEGFDPERVVERTLDARAFKAVDQWRGDVRFVSYAVPDAPPSAPSEMLGLDFGESGIYLSGVALAERALRPGEIVQLTLFWEATQTIEGRYKVFVHILDQNGQLVAQRDSEPVGNLKPTDRWEVGETVIDNHGVLLPADLPAGEYQLLFGLYDFFDPAVRLTVAEVDGDSVNLGELSVNK